MPFRAEKGDMFGWHKKGRGQAQLEGVLRTHRFEAGIKKQEDKAIAIVSPMPYSNYL